jgi:hypothetical protein
MSKVGVLEEVLVVCDLAEEDFGVSASVDKLTCDQAS